MYAIIDISEHNGKVDFELLNKYADGVIIRLGYGDNLKSQDDAQAKRNISECNRLNIPYGVYLYSYAENETMLNSEIEHINRLLIEYDAKPTLPIYLDIEESKTWSVACELAIKFVRYYKKTKYKCGIYSSAYWWKYCLKSSLLRNGYEWVAQYNDTCQIDKWYMWQFTDKFKIGNNLFDCSYLNDDIVKYIDTDRVLKDVSRETLDKWNNKYEQIAKDVLNNKYGTGVDRKKKILSMGYDYEMVQDFVNEMLK